MDIWNDEQTMMVLHGGQVLEDYNPNESSKIRKRILQYHWNHDQLMFKTLVILKPKEHKQIILDLHIEIGHFGERCKLVEVNKRYYWHNRTNEVKVVVRSCKQCQLVRRTGSIRSEIEELRTIPILNQFYQVALNTNGHLPKTNSGNKYIFVAVDHYSKWVEAKAIANHGVKTTARFLEDEIICSIGVPKHVLKDNGGEWGAEFDQLCKNYGIDHQYTAPWWPGCNGMAKRLVKTDDLCKEG